MQKLTGYYMRSSQSELRLPVVLLASFLLGRRMIQVYQMTTSLSSGPNKLALLYFVF